MNALAKTVTTAARSAPVSGQRRGIVSWMTNYPDKVRVERDGKRDQR